MRNICRASLTKLRLFHWIYFILIYASQSNYLDIIVGNTFNRAIILEHGSVSVSSFEFTSTKHPAFKSEWFFSTVKSSSQWQSSSLKYGQLLFSSLGLLSCSIIRFFFLFLIICFCLFSFLQFYFLFGFSLIYPSSILVPLLLLIFSPCIHLNYYYRFYLFYQLRY